MHVNNTRNALVCNLGTGRAPWRVLWEFTVTRAGSFARDCDACCLLDAESSKTMETPQFKLFRFFLFSCSEAIWAI